MVNAAMCERCNFKPRLCNIFFTFTGYFYKAMNDTDSFHFLGLNIAVSKADWTPVIISFGIAALGVIVSLFGKRKL